MKKLILIFLLLAGYCMDAQVPVSVAPDLSVMRNFSPKQKFWAIGETVQFQFHFSEQQTAYVWLAFYTPGKFRNDFTATAKSPSTFPSAIGFTAREKWRNREISLGWKHYFKGKFDTKTGYNIYSIAGFGLLSAKVENVFTPAIDTNRYVTPTLAGNGIFYRLTIDLGAGVEFPFSENFFLFGDIRTWIPTTNYDSPYLHSNEKVPFPFIIGGGLRMLFGY